MPPRNVTGEFPGLSQIAPPAKVNSPVNILVPAEADMTKLPLVPPPTIVVPSNEKSNPDTVKVVPFAIDRLLLMMVATSVVVFVLPPVVILLKVVLAAPPIVWVTPLNVTVLPELLNVPPSLVQLPVTLNAPVGAVRTPLVRAISVVETAPVPPVKVP